MMKRNKYSAGAVKFGFWYLEFKKTIGFLVDGKTWDDIKLLSKEENIYGASTPARGDMIFSTVKARIVALDESIFEIFMDSDVSTQKLIALAGALAHDTLFFDFVYEVIREKVIIGINEVSDADIRIFFRDKQDQSEVASKWTEQTLQRLGRSYKSHLYEAGILDDNKLDDPRRILPPILDPVFSNWLRDYGYEEIGKALEGVR